jgi:hypothetical protein
VARREEIIDAVYALGDFELVSLVAFDMGDEPVPPKKKQETAEKKAPVQAPHVVEKQLATAPAMEEKGWGPVAFWTALLGGSMLWVGGAWWWRGQKSRRTPMETIT